MSSRRSFLREVAAATAVFPFASAASARPGQMDPAAHGEAYWNLVRAQFSFREDKVPMNAANLCPSTRSVSERVTELTADIDRDCSFQQPGKVRGSHRGVPREGRRPPRSRRR